MKLKVKQIMGNTNKFQLFLYSRTMRISRYDEAEGGEIKLEACEYFFRF